VPAPESLFQDRPTVWLFALSGFSSFGRLYIVEQNIVQRYLVARTDREAQRAVFTGASFCVVIWQTFMVIGACLWAFYHMTGAAVPAAIQQKPDNILPYFKGGAAWVDEQYHVAPGTPFAIVAGSIFSLQA